MPADAARRQGDIARLAFLLLGGRDAAMEFLNNPDEALGARPIDLSVSGEEGHALVQRRIGRLVGAGITNP